MAVCLGTDFELEPKRLKEIVEKAQFFALSSGLALRSPKDVEDGVVLAEIVPFMLFPSAVPRSSLQKMKDCMTDFNQLIHRVAHDHQFLETALKNVVPVDDFTRGLWNIYTTVREEGFTQPISLGLFRSDFMMSVEDPNEIQPKQVEFNTIAAGSNGFAFACAHLHRVTLGVVGKQYEPDQVPHNNPNTGSTTGIIKAWELYGNKQVKFGWKRVRYGPVSIAIFALQAPAVILFMVPDGERSVFDQSAMEFAIYSVNPTLRVIRRTLTDIANTGTLTRDKRLFVDQDEVAVIYMRSCYGPANYPTQKEWDARLMMERSLAIKCPSIQYQLAGTKKIQQELARPGSVERFLQDKEAVQRIRKTFMEQHSLDLGPEGDKSVQLALSNPDKYVLKPQREGGGNNLYGEDMVKFLQQHQDSSERSAWILMERIFPPSQKNYMLKFGASLVLSDVVTEVGAFGVYMGSATEELMNTECGHMIRSKSRESNEGGICIGLAVVDTPFLVSDEEYRHHLHTHVNSGR